MKKAICLVLVLCCLCCLAACGRPAAVEKTDAGYTVTAEAPAEEPAEPAATAEPETTPEPTQEPTEEPTQEPTQEPTAEPLPFAEEAGWQMSAPAEVTVPVGQYGTADYIEFNPLTTTLSAPQITRSEPDEEGYVTYTVTYEAPMGTDIYFEGETLDDVNFGTNDYQLFDYYTGMHIPASLYVDLKNGARSDDSAFGTLVEYEGRTYEVSLKTDITTDEPEEEILEEGNGLRYRLHVSASQTMIIRAPQDYDGLVIGLDTGMPGSLGKQDDDELEAEFWDELDNADPESWIFIRLDDHLTEAE